MNSRFNIIYQVIIELLVQFVARGKPCRITGKSDECPALSNAIVLIVGGIPVAMPTVCASFITAWIYFANSYI